MGYTKEEIISEYNKVRRTLGRCPTSREFYAGTNVTKYDAEVAFGSRPFSSIQIAMGDTPKRFGQSGRSPDEFFAPYGEVVRKLGRIPTMADWKHRSIRPTANSYRIQLKIAWSDMPCAFRDWAADKPEWQDVVEICNASCSREQSIGKEASSRPIGHVYLMKSGKFHKIGRTNSLGRREYELANQRPEGIKTIHRIRTDDPVGVEAYWKNRFKDKRKKGEYFELSAEDVSAFKRWKKIW